MLLLFTFIFGFLKNVRISYDDSTLKESVTGISRWLTTEGREKYVSSSVGLCEIYVTIICCTLNTDLTVFVYFGPLNFVTKTKPHAFSNKYIFSSVVYFRKCRR